MTSKQTKINLRLSNVNQSGNKNQLGNILSPNHGRRQFVKTDLLSYLDTLSMKQRKDEQNLKYKLMKEAHINKLNKKDHLKSQGGKKRLNNSLQLDQHEFAIPDLANLRRSTNYSFA